MRTDINGGTKGNGRQWAVDSALVPPLDRAESAGDLMTVVPAEPSRVRAARAFTRRWLDGLAWPLEDAEDIELAVNEAIANVVDHAYPAGSPGSATLHAWVSTEHRSRRVVVVVTDHGRWAAHHPGSPAPETRGHGLVMMSGCMAELHIQRAAAGTTVIMVSTKVAAAP